MISHDGTHFQPKCRRRCCVKTYHPGSPASSAVVGGDNATARFCAPIFVLVFVFVFVLVFVFVFVFVFVLDGGATVACGL